MNFLLILLLPFIAKPDLSHIRQLYAYAADNETYANQLLIESERPAEDTLLFMGYRGAAKMILAKHAGNPFKKLNLFNDGKNILESAIASDTANVELRYLRLTIQSNIPKFLGYNSMIDADKIFLSREVERLSDNELKTKIEKYLVQTNKI
jgi:hypothetical protein